jgi:manganese transport protein
MGAFVIPGWVAVLSGLVAGIILVLNFKLLLDTFFG